MTTHQVQSVTPQQAWELVEKNPRAVLIDVRSHMEYLFIGHPVGAINIPWIDEPEWKINAHFATEVRRLILGGISTHDEMGSVPIVLICRSGKRSLDAGELLLNEGFNNVYNVVEGFEGELDEHHHRSAVGGWRFHNLPWEQC